MAYNTISVVPSGLPDKEQILPINVTFTDNNGKTTVIPTELPTAGRGPAGKDGTTWYLGLPEPTDSSFSVDGIPETGDIYLCTVSCNLYKYTGAEWNFTQKLQVRGLLGVSKLTGEKVGETVHLNISYNDGSSDVFSFDIPVPHIDLSSYISTKPISTGVSPNSLEVGKDTINYKVNNLEVGTALNVDGDTTFSKTPKIKLANGLDTTPVSEPTQTDVPTKGWVDTNYTYKYTTLPATPNAGKNSYTVSTDTIFSGTATFNTPVALESIGSDVPGKTTSIAASTSWVDKYYAQITQTLPADYDPTANLSIVTCSVSFGSIPSLVTLPSDTPGSTTNSIVSSQWVDAYYLPRSTVYVTTDDNTVHTGVNSVYIDKASGNAVVKDKQGTEHQLQASGNYITTPADSSVGSDVKSLGVDKSTQRFIGKTDDGEIIYSASLADIAPLITATAAMVGIPQPWPTDDIPAGYLLCDGSAFDKTLYPALAKMYPSGKVPDLRGMFLRGLDPTGNVDNYGSSPRTVLSKEEGSYILQDDQRGAVVSFVNRPFTELGWDYPDGHTVPATVGAWTGREYFFQIYSSQQVGIARPKNVAFNYIVFTGAGLRSVDVGTADLDSTKYFPLHGGLLNGSVYSTDVNGDTQYTIRPYQPNNKGFFQVDYGSSGNVKLGTLNADPSQFNVALSNGTTTAQWTFNRDKQTITTPANETVATEEWVDSNYVTKSNLQNTVESLQTSITQTATTVNESLTPKLEALSQSISDTQSTLNDTITKQIDTLNTQVSDQNKTLSDQITQEVSRAKGQEASLSSSITSLSTQVSTDVNTLNESISTETTRAQSAESKLSQSITDETSRAETQEASLSKSITDINTALANEVARATGKEGQLDTEISTLTKSISDESSRAQSAESELTKSIGTTNTALQAEVTRATDKETDLSNQITSVQKSVTDETSRAENAEAALSKSVMDTNTALQSEISRAEGKESELSSDITTVQKSVSDESSRAQTEEAALSKAISDESTRAQAAEKTNATNITNNTQAIASEVSRAEAAETALSDDISKVSKDLTTEVSRAQGVENTLTNSVQALTTDLSNETARATKAEEANSQAISAEQTRATQAEETLTTNIASETKRAQEAESSLSSALSGEVSRATQAETQLNAQITQEAQRAQSAEDKLRQSLSGYAPLDAVDYSKLSDLKLQAQTAANLTSSMVGIPVPWPSNTIPEGFLLCDGSGFDTNTYSALAQVYPNGKLPDLRGMFIRGLDPTGNVDNASSGTRQLGTFEEGSFAIQDIHGTSDGFYLNNDVTGDGTRNLNWDKRVDISKVLNYAYVPGPAYANTGMFGSAAASEMVGVMRPKNIAFNYIVFAGKYLQKATMGFSASDNVDFTGQVGFEKIPTVNLIDTAPVTPATNTQVASKQWVDTQYASKADIDYNKFSSLEKQAQNSINTVSSLVGIPLPWPSNTVPDGYLLCDGSSFDVNTYDLLAEAYPSGKLPDLRGMFIRGLDPTGNIDNVTNGPRQILTFEEGTRVAKDSGNGIANFNSDNTHTNSADALGWDYFNNPNETHLVIQTHFDSFAFNQATPVTTAASNNDRLLGITRPKNIAFNYIVYTGKSLSKASVGLLASDDVEFTGNVSFDKVPLVKVTDTTPISANTQTQVASKMWVDSLYASKSDVDYTKFASLERQAQLSVNTVSSLVGMPLPWPGQNVPDGYLLCDGSSFDPTVYPLLSEAYPDNKLPDLRGMFIRGLDPSGNVDNVVGGRKLLSFEDGSFLLKDRYSYSPISINGDVSGKNTAVKLGWDLTADPNATMEEIWANGAGGYGAVGGARFTGPDGTTDSTIGISRPKNVAFNYIVYTGKSLNKVNVDLLASDDVQFTGNVSYTKVPTLTTVDTSPVSASTQNQIASKQWVDTNYATKSDIDYTKLSSLENQAQQSVNAVSTLVGIPLPWPSASIPQGYLLCDGSAFDINMYPLLAKAYPDGKLPDLRGMFIRGLDPTGNIDSYNGTSRTLLSHEEGTVDGYSFTTDLAAVVYNRNATPYTTHGLDWVGDPNQHYAVSFATAYTGTWTAGNIGNSNAYSLVGVTRPKNVAFNYIVYTGQSLQRADTSLVASSDANFIGNITFSKVPTLSVTDTSPVSSQTAQQIASKAWTDANYVSKATIETSVQPAIQQETQRAQQVEQQITSSLSNYVTKDAVDYNQLESLKQQAQKSINTVSTLVGIPMPWPTNTIPDGYLLCDGSGFDVTQYNLLAEVYPDGKLPDLRGMFIRGLDTTGNIDNVIGGRKILTREEGSFLIQDSFVAVSNFYLNNNPNPDPNNGGPSNAPAGLNWDKRDDPNENFAFAFAFSNGQSGTNAAGSGIAGKDMVSVARPKNIAFNYIVYTGKTLQKASVNLLASDDVDFTGTVSFEKTPTLKSTDTTPISDSNKSDVASKSWVDSNYAQKNGVDAQSLENAKQSALAAANTVNNMVGIPLPWPTTTIPQGYLLCDGSGFDVNRYPKLAAMYPTGKLPDLRGMFIRGLDPTGNVDGKIGRAVLSFEEGTAVSFMQQPAGWPLYPWAQAPADAGVDIPLNNTTLQVVSVSPGGTYSASAYPGDGKSYKGSWWGPSRPKNIAFNYIVYTGDPTVPATVGLLASEDTNFTGKVTFTQPPQVASNDTTPVTASSVNDAASKGWVDANYATKVQNAQALGASAQNALNTISTLVGIPMPWPTATIPQGYLLCDGSSFDTGRYPLLAKVYPNGQLPDLRGMFIRGLDPTGNVDNYAISGGRPILSTEEGSALLEDTGSAVVNFGRQGKLDDTDPNNWNSKVNLGWDKRTLNQNPYDYQATTAGNYNTRWLNSINPSGFDCVGVARPKNIAFNYIVFTGQGVTTADVSLIAKSDVEFSGNVSFDIIPKVNNLDTTPVNPNNKNDIANKNWVDSNYLNVSGGQLNGTVNLGQINATSSVLNLVKPDAGSGPWSAGATLNFPLENAGMNMWPQVDGQRGNSVQLVLGGNNTSGVYHTWNFNPTAKNILSPDFNPYPEIMGFGNSQRVVTQCFYVQINNDIQQIFFPVPFASATGINIQCTLAGYPAGGAATRIPYFGAPMADNSGYPITATSFWVDMSGAGHGQGAGFWVQATGVMN